MSGRTRLYLPRWESTDEATFDFTWMGEFRKVSWCTVHDLPYSFNLPDQTAVCWVWEDSVGQRDGKACVFSEKLVEV